MAGLQREIDDLALITEAQPPVVTRILFSKSDLRGREFVKKICVDAGLDVRADAVGNMFACWRGRDAGLPAVATGSHIDAIPNAGKYDGVVGVLGAIEAIRTLRRAGFKPERSIELIIFTAEEPTLFGIGCLGSRLLSGVLSPQKAANLRDSEGNDLEYWRNQADCTGGLETVPLHKNCYSSFIELHIEQGPILERENLEIGIVEKIAAPSALRIRLTGVGGHAGAVLMPDRHDAGLAGAEIALAVERAVSITGSPDTVGTTGIFRMEPGAINSVPCRVLLEIDVRDTNMATRDIALRHIEKDAIEICRRRGVELDLAFINMDPTAQCDGELVKTIQNICQSLKIPHRLMISRAYHDSLFMAQVCPTTMIFIPCLRGMSHRPDEYSSPGQIERGVQVLATTLAQLAAVRAD